MSRWSKATAFRTEKAKDRAHRVMYLIGKGESIKRAAWLSGIPYRSALRYVHEAR